MEHDERKAPKLAGEFLTIYVSHASFPNTPELQLFYAILEDGCVWALKPLNSPKSSTHKRMLIREARVWMDNCDDRWPCSFISCCHILGIQPSSLRISLQEHIDEKERACGNCPPI